MLIQTEPVHEEKAMDIFAGTVIVFVIF